MKEGSKKIQVLVSGMIIFFCLGIVYIWSIFQKSAMEYFSWSQSDAALTFNIMMVTIVAGMYVGGCIQNKRGTKFAVFLAGGLFAAGILFSSFVPVKSPWLLYIFYGGMSGFGVGMAYSTTISCVQKWFPHKKGFATGILVCAYGASSLALAPLANTLLKYFSLLPTFRLLAILFFIIVLFFAFFIRDPNKYEVQTVIHSKGSIHAIQCQPIADYTTKEASRTKSFYMIMFLIFLYPAAYFILNPLFKILALNNGLSESIAVLGVMLTGAASASGRFLFPLLSDYKGRKLSLMLIFIITLAATFLLIFVQRTTYIYAIILVAFCYGGAAGIFPVILSDYYGSKHVSSTYGMTMIGYASIAILAPVLLKMLHPEENGYAPVFFIPAAACIIGVIVTLILKKPVNIIKKEKMEFENKRENIA